MTAKRVLFINDTVRNGGPGRSLHCILSYVDPALIHRSVLLSRPGPISELLESTGVVDELLFEEGLIENPFEPAGRAMERGDFDASKWLKGVRLTRNVGRLAWGLWATKRRLAGGKTGKYDLIYCNGTNANFFGAALSLATGVPCLWHVRYTSIPGAVAALHARLAESAQVKRIVCVSAASAALFPQCPEKTVVIHNAVNLADFDRHRILPSLRKELKLPKESVIFGSHGRVLRRKGYLEMVDAAAKLRERVSADDWARYRFVVVGDTPEDFPEDHVAICRQRAAEQNLSDVFHFLGFRADVRPYVADFDVAVVPSVYPDPLPRSVIESMALAKPVIGFDLGGIPEMIQEGRTGALVRGAPPDIDGLAAAMMTYGASRELREAHGRAAREHIEREFSGQRHGELIQEQILLAAL